MNLKKLLDDNEIPQTELVAALKMNAPTVNRKLLGRRKWSIDEAGRVVAFLRERLGNPDLTIESVFVTRPAPARRSRRVA